MISSGIKTEILATIGPASVDRLHEMYGNGLCGIRINSSHGNSESHTRAILNSRAVNPGGYIVYDIKGPKIRIGDLPAPVKLRAGERIVLRTDFPKPVGSDYPRVDNISEGIPVSFELLHEYVEVGDRFFVDDGYIGLSVVDVNGCRIECEVLYGDLLRSRKGLNHPDTHVGYPFTMPQDLPNLEFAIKMKVDYIADSFTRCAEDVLELRDRLKGTSIRIISKIENPEGVENFDSILEKTDAVMIARGDLGVELAPWLLPELQKEMIEKCNIAGRPVITATQMLESMMENPHPSRADVSDIANAIYDGTDLIMLSGETSIGKYPDKCVMIMKKIAESVEKTARYRAKKQKLNGLSSLFNS